jgi:hypothetical protein
VGRIEPDFLQVRNQNIANNLQNKFKFALVKKVSDVEFWRLHRSVWVGEAEPISGLILN